jgi:hypothetical protein
MSDEPLSFMARLKRQHIFRVASVYAIGAWVLIQLANSIFPDLGWPQQDEQRAQQARHEAQCNNIINLIAKVQAVGGYTSSLAQAYSMLNCP